jgi:hypothetical protein
MKTLKELKGVKELSKKEQKTINGGKLPCYHLSAGSVCVCRAGYECVSGMCCPISIVP